MLSIKPGFRNTNILSLNTLYLFVALHSTSQHFDETLEKYNKKDHSGLFFDFLMEKIERENDPLIGSLTISTKYSQVFQSMSYNEISIAARAAAYSEFAVAPPVYSEIPVAAPPVYAEAPHDDLAAELAQMKAMMEQMRLEKERMETEARRKAAEEEKLKAETEAKRKAEAEEVKQKEEQEEACALANFFKPKQDSVRSWAYGSTPGGHYGWNLVRFFQEIDKSGENLIQILSSSQGEYTQYIHDIIITDRHIYRVIGFGGYGQPESVFTVKYLSKVYTFNTQLTLKQVRMIDTTINYKDDYVVRPIGSRVSDRISNPMGGQSKCDMDARKKFESVIRLIPGSYKNGDWRQLDGFFGMYFNETTMEVSEMPPPSL